MFLIKIKLFNVQFNIKKVLLTLSAEKLIKNIKYI